MNRVQTRQAPSHSELEPVIITSSDRYIQCLHDLRLTSLIFALLEFVLCGESKFWKSESVWIYTEVRFVNKIVNIVLNDADMWRHEKMAYKKEKLCFYLPSGIQVSNVHPSWDRYAWDSTRLQQPQRLIKRNGMARFRERSIDRWSSWFSVE